MTIRVMMMMMLSHSLSLMIGPCKSQPQHLPPFGASILKPRKREWMRQSLWQQKGLTMSWLVRRSSWVFWQALPVPPRRDTFVCENVSRVHKSAFSRTRFVAFFSWVVCDSGMGDQCDEREANCIQSRRETILPKWEREREKLASQGQGSQVYDWDSQKWSAQLKQT